MQNNHFNLKDSAFLSLEKAVRLAMFSVSCTFFSFGFSFCSCLATSFDTSDNNSSSPQGSVNANASAGAGVGQYGAVNQGNTNVSFSNFGVVPDADPRSNDVSNPADLLPVNHSNTVTSNAGQLQINNYASSQVKPNEWASGISGTSPTQAPQGNGGLGPTTSALQAPYMINSPIPSGQYNFGFKPQLLTPYHGPYDNYNYGAGFSPGSVPPATSLGSVDFDITSQ